MNPPNVAVPEGMLMPMRWRSAVPSESCTTMSSTTKPFLRMDRESITYFAKLGCATGTVRVKSPKEASYGSRTVSKMTRPVEPVTVLKAPPVLMKWQVTRVVAV